MSTYLRNNAWNNQGTFDNSDLLWYAKAVGALQSRALDDESSWWFFAAMHGEYIEESTFPGWGTIPGPPAVPVAPVPSASVQGKFWNQCQHQSWYFVPWHRGYLIALEGHLRKAVIDLGGPDDWALPYWNYLGGDGQYKIPPAFTQKNLPDGAANPLYVNARFGPKGDRNIYIEIPPISGDCQKNTLYTGSNSQTTRPGYGGPKSGFSHGGNVSGNLESNPHNKVHVQVGGQANDIWGLMSDPGIAALDPIFYLHHANIDRMWAAWNALGNSNPTDPNWLKGPTASGDRKFMMPMVDGTTWNFTPAEVDSLSKLDYTYEGLDTESEPLLADALTKRFTKLGINTDNLTIDAAMDKGDTSELIGANEKALHLQSDGVKANVKLSKQPLKTVRNSLKSASISSIPDHIYLQIENVKGNIDANMLSVSVNDTYVDHVSLFGLRNASKVDGHHGGEGLTFILNITDVFDDLHINDALDINELDVKIVPDNDIAASHDITIGRVSIYREQQGS
jgi:tyrosinase